VFLPRRNDTILPPDELLGLRGEAFHIGSDAEEAKKAEKPQQTARLGSIFGIARGSSRNTMQSTMWEVGSLALETRRQRGETYVQEGEGSEPKKKGGLSGLSHRHENKEAEVEYETYTLNVLSLLMTSIR